MNSRFAVAATVALVLGLLVALNALSYAPAEAERVDSEARPDRSTYNAGATGTRAFYEYLQESGHKVVRWRQPPSILLGGETESDANAARPSTFVVVGKLRREFAEGEIDSLLLWARRGGRLVIIDRAPAPGLLPASGGWGVASEVAEEPSDGAVVATSEEKLQTLAPAQPTSLTRDVQEVARSRYAGRLHVFPISEGGDDDDNSEQATASGESGSRAPVVYQETEQPESMPWPWATPTPAGVIEIDELNVQEELQASPAPVVHVAEAGGGSNGGSGASALLVDYRYGRGRVVVLSDPFVVSNGGLARADNLLLAANVVAAGAGGTIAFDEYHQGRVASAGNLVREYFRGTPALALLAQLAAVGLAVLWTRSRRFARPLPAPRVDRRSELEFVASMAELQQRARAYDLALENVYRRPRRALARYGGAGADANYEEIAERVASRSGRNAGEVGRLLRECEDAIAGEPLDNRRALALVARLRRLERELGIRLRAREVRQAGRGGAGGGAL